MQERRFSNAQKNYVNLELFETFGNVAHFILRRAAEQTMLKNRKVYQRCRMVSQSLKQSADALHIKLLGCPYISFLWISP